VPWPLTLHHLYLYLFSLYYLVSPCPIFRRVCAPDTNPTVFSISLHNLLCWFQNLWSFTTPTSLACKRRSLTQWFDSPTSTFFNFFLILVLVTYITLILIRYVHWFQKWKWLGLRDRICYVIKLLNVKNCWIDLICLFLHSWLKSDKIVTCVFLTI